MSYDASMILASGKSSLIMTKKERRLKGPNDKQRYDELSNKYQAYKASVNYAENRLSPSEYYNRRFSIKKITASA